MSSLFAFKKTKKRSGSEDVRRTSEHNLKETRKRSKSLENITEMNTAEAPSIVQLTDDGADAWSELECIKSQDPIIVCILPTVAQDFVASCLLSVGANPLFPEDADDVITQLSNCKAVLVDVSSRKELIEAFINAFIADLTPLIMCCTDCGVDDHRKSIAKRLIEKCSPAVISGRMGDIHSLGTELVELAEGIINEEDVNFDEVDRNPSPNLSLASMGKPRSLSRASPRSSPAAIRKKFDGKFHRTNTGIPHAIMKGQFRQCSMKCISPDMALQSGRNLAFHKNVKVHLFETNILTCGEFFIEINNTQLGAECLHSTTQCAAAIIAAVAACIEQEGSTLTLTHCAHALCMYHVAIEESVAEVLDNSEIVRPGALRTHFIDTLHLLDEPTIRFKAQLSFHNALPNQ